ncbi:hypothetical protein [Clostridium sp. YIM B02555]|jgi:hypothetical protein|uniref:hypothetical protein n=1 Tax=Clostridium sp. YIM B02555 TaxID=2911968 RepID=UPI001EEEAD1E|nr:hypothetical protein [Clostridium sp. YIM B02555]
MKEWRMNKVDWRKELTGYLEKDEEIPAKMVQEWTSLPLSNLDKLLKIHYDACKLSTKLYHEEGELMQYFDASLAKLILAIASDKDEEGVKYLFDHLDKEALKRIKPFTEIEHAQLILLRYIVEDNDIYALFEKMTLMGDNNMQKFIKCLLKDGSGNPNISDAKSRLFRKMEIKKVIDKLDLLSNDIISDDDEIYDSLDKWYDEDKHYYISEVIKLIPENKWSKKLIIEYVCACNNTNEPNEAIECLKKYDFLGDESAVWHYLYGYALCMLKQYENAIIEFKHSLAIDLNRESSKEMLEKCEKVLAKINHKKVKRKNIVIEYDGDKSKYFVKSGAFDLGYLGCYEAKKIEVEFDIEDIPDGLENIVNSEMKQKVIAKKLSQFYQERQKELLENQNEINNTFLQYIFNDITDCEYPFWETENGEIESFIIKRKMPKNPEDVFSSEVLDKIGQASEEYYEKPNDGSIKKTDMKLIISECFPMIKIKSLIDLIEPEYLVFNGANVSFQCSSDVCGGMLICSAYAEIHKDNSFWDWHNH